MSGTFQGCRHIQRLLAAQRKVILEHLAEHKWYQHIADENLGVLDFIAKYGFVMREMYCGFACPERHSCEWTKSFMQKDIVDPDLPEEPFAPPEDNIGNGI